MGQETSEGPKYLLGIDLGSASLGWALVELDASGRPSGLLSRRTDGQALPGCGVRIFQPGVEGTALDIEQGKDQSKAVARRMARLHRRQLRRKAYRQTKLFRLLQEQGLLPRCVGPDAPSPSEERNAVLTALDRELSRRQRGSDGSCEFHQLPLYSLRKAALDRKLEPYELGRVIYHLSQRRGFKSNRKETASAEKNKEIGAVKTGIADLQGKMNAADARTLGEYLAGLDPHHIGQNVGRRWTGRTMYEDEFAKIWESQGDFYPALLTDNLRRQVEHLLFFQRPIAAQSHLIGNLAIRYSEVNRRYADRHNAVDCCA